MEMEIWKPINGFEGLYEISNYGQVKSLNFNRTKIPALLKPNNVKGYMQVQLYKKRYTKYIKVHQLVAAAFIPNPELKCCVNHIDGNKDNNRTSNLEWTTHRENIQHAFAHGLRAVGSKHARSRISANDVLQIRALRGKLTQKEIAKKFGLRQPQISSIQLNQSWKIVA